MYDDPRPEQDNSQVLPRGPTSQPYRTPRRTRRETGVTEVWVEGRGYVPENSLDRLNVQERNSVLEARANAQRLSHAIPDLDRFEELNRTQPTGSWGQQLGQFFGDLPEYLGDPEVEEMRAITNRLTPLMRPAGAGATSDFEGRMYQGSLPNRGRVGPANSNIIQNLRRQAQEAQTYAEFLDWYWPRNGGTTGALEEWGRYRSQGEGRPWREFFNAGGGQPQRAGGQTQPAPAQAQRPDPLGIR